MIGGAADQPSHSWLPFSQAVFFAPALGYASLLSHRPPTLLQVPKARRREDLIGAKLLAPLTSVTELSARQ